MRAALTTLFVLLLAAPVVAGGDAENAVADNSTEHGWQNSRVEVVRR